MESRHRKVLRSLRKVVEASDRPELRAEPPDAASYRAGNAPNTSRRCPEGFAFDGKHCVPVRKKKNSAPTKPGSSKSSALPRDPPESRRQDDPDDFPNTREHEKSAQQKDIPLVPDPKSEVMQRLHNAVTLSNGLRSFEYAEAEYKEYAHSGFIQSKFPDAFKDKQDFIAEFLNGDHVAVSDWASIKNTSASEQPEGDYPSLFKKFWEFQGTKWAEKGVDDKTNEERFKTYLDGLIEKADAEDEETTPPVIVGVHRDPTLGTETSWLLAGNSRALLYAFIGKAAPTRMVPLKGRMLPDPTEEELQTVLWPAESSSEDDDELEQNVRAAVQQVIAGRGGQPPGGSPPPPEAAVPPAPAAAPPAAAPPEAAAPPQEAVLRVLKTIFESEYKHPSGHTKRLFSKAFKTLGYPVGTVRNWARGKVIKTRDGWEEVPAGTKAPKIATPLVPAAQHDQPRPKLALKRAAAAPPVANLPARDSDEAHWIEAIPDFPAETTQKHYGPNRAPKAYRQKLHNSIISKYFDKVPAPSAETLRTKKPVAIMLMGGPASGKSTIGGAYPDTQFIHLDADALKEHLPEYKVATKWRAKNAAKMTHEESIHLMQQLREKTISARKNLVMDGTGRHVTSYLNMITKLKTAGYHVKVVLADIDQDLARKRAKIRAQSGGRWVPPHVFDAAYAAVPKNFAEIASAAHEFELWDTRPEGEPQLKWEKTGGEEHIHDPVFVERFQKQYVREPNRGAVYPPHKRRPVSFVPSKQTKAEAVAALKNIFVLG